MGGIILLIWFPILMRSLPGRRAQRLLIRCVRGVGDYFASKVNQINESGANRKKVNQIDGSGAVGVRPSAAELLRFFEKSPTSFRCHSLYIENQQICKKSILQRIYTQIRISRWVVTWDTKVVTSRLPRYPPRPEFGMHLPTISPEVLPCPKDPKNH